MSMAGSDITVEILKDIRDEIRGVRAEFRTEIGGVRGELQQLRSDTNQRLDSHTARLEMVESVLLDLAEQQRFVVRYTKAISERDTGSSRT
jgi:hypothetical protein